MKLQTRYGGFTATVNSRIAAFVALVLCLAASLAHAQTGQTGAEPVKLAILGDSLAAGYGLAPAQAFPARLQATLKDKGRNVTVINHGVSGDTTAGGLARIDWALGDDPDAVIVALGGNDLLRGLDTGEMRTNLDGILSAIEARGLPMILAGLPAPPNYGEDYRRAFNGMFRDLARDHGAIYYKSFLSGMGQGRNMFQVMRLMQPDGIHPNAEGVEAIVDHIGPVVLELIDEARR